MGCRAGKKVCNPHKPSKPLIFPPSKKKLDVLIFSPLLFFTFFLSNLSFQKDFRSFSISIYPTVSVYPSKNKHLNYLPICLSFFFLVAKIRLHLFVKFKEKMKNLYCLIFLWKVKLVFKIFAWLPSEWGLKYAWLFSNK